MTFLEALFVLAIGFVATIAIILVARPLVARIAGANWAYALWSVLLVPPLAALTPPTVAEGIRLWSYSSLSVPSTGSLQTGLVGLWLVGAVLTGLMSFRRSAQVRSTIEESSRPLSVEQRRQVERSCMRANVFPPPKTVISPSVVSPAVMAGLNPMMVLPDDFFLKYSASERNLVLLHELVHIRRFDLVWNILFRGLRCLLWFIPFIGGCERLFRADQERSCDHSVVCDEPSRGRVDYARALYKTAIPRSNAIGTARFRNSRRELVVRTELLGEHRRTNTRSLAGFLALAVCALLAVGVSANSSSLSETPIPSSGWCSVYDGLGL